MTPGELWLKACGGIADAEWTALHAIARSIGLYAGSVLTYFAFLAWRRGDFSPRRILRESFPPDLYSGATWRVDFPNWLVRMTLLEPIGRVAAVLFSLGAGVALSVALAGRFGTRPPVLTATWAIVAVQVAARFWAQEMADYGLHRAAHRVGWLWCLHRTHHSTEVLTFFAASRSHPIELFTFLLPVTVLAPAIATGLTLYLTGTQLLPATIATLAYIYLFFGFSSQFLSHSHVPLSYGRFNVIVGAPIMHQIHHSAEVRHRERNFGTNTLIFDWLFGTLYVPKPGESWRLGVNERERGEMNPHRTLRDLYLEPFARMRAPMQGAAPTPDESIRAA